MRVAVVYNRDVDEDRGRPDQTDVAHQADDVARALTSRGHRVMLVSVGEHGVTPLVQSLEALRGQVDLVFNLVESLGGDARNEPVVPSLLDLIGIPYTGSGPIALGLALAKDRCKRLLRAAGVTTPDWIMTTRVDKGDDLGLPFPLIVKPSREDASVGIDQTSVVRDGRALARRVDYIARTFAQPALVERYVEGREIYVSLIGGGARAPIALPMHEIDFAGLPPNSAHIVTYAGKWNPESIEYRGTTPRKAERLSPALVARIVRTAQDAFAALELRDYARVDLRVTADGTPYVIDVNPNCDLSAGAGVARAASYANWTYPKLIDEICRAALSRARPKKDPHAKPSGARPRSQARPVSVKKGKAEDRAAPARARGSSGARGAHRGGGDVSRGRTSGRARARR